MARFFIDRPVFAWVIAIVIMIAGSLSITRLPISRYPTIAPPTITISATYPGASAQVVQDSVTQIIEQNMKALDGLLYMSSTSQSNGAAAVTLTFANGTNADIAQVQVQNKLQLATALLPQVVQQQGISVTKTGEGFLLVIGFVSGDGSMSRDDISDFITTNIVDPLSRVPGVGSTQVFGSRYAMRIWLDPDKLNVYHLSTADVIAAIQAQNQQVAVGQLGGSPSVAGQMLNATINARGRMQTPEQFRQVVIRSGSQGSTLRLGDIARVELGAESYGIISRFNGQPASGVAVSLATGANALQTANAVSQLMHDLQPTFPAGLKTVIPFDSTPFVRVAIHEVVKTLLEAIGLVFIVMFLFLQNIRATLIPTIAVPVVLLGTFAVLAVVGFSINMLTMFAMVLAIGLLVDDAIVVVENVERLMTEEGLTPLEATRRSMDQITGALVGIGLILSAVFVPMAFLGGSTGVIYRQFSGTIVSAMALSVLIALILTPALCATMLKPVRKGHHYHDTGFFSWFNRTFDRGSRNYQGVVTRVLSKPMRAFAVFLVMAGLAVLLFLKLPTAFLPSEDQGILYAQVQAPAGATQERTLAVLDQVEKYFLQDERAAVDSMFIVQGFSFSGVGQNAGMAFVRLRDWDERKSADLGPDALAARAMARFSQIKDALVYAFAPPPVTELGTSAGFVFYLQDTAGQGHEALIAARNQLLGAAAQDPLLVRVRPGGQEDTPELRIDIDNQKAAALEIPPAEINTTLGVAWGGRYIDDFIDRGRVKRVFVQADAPFRMVPEDLNRWSVHNARGEMVPFASFASARWTYGSPRLERYNGLPAVQINGEGAPGVSSGAAMAEMERLASRLPGGFTIAWTGASYQERAAGAQTPLLYSLSLAMVFLCLAALYESWTVPTAVLLAAPLGILGTVLANFLRGMERDIYFQVAMLTTVGLTSKNAILIVEFARENIAKGMQVGEAIMAAVRDRLRPILMTSLAFGLGVLPLAISTGAGAGAQRAIGTGVLGGMLIGTFLGLVFVPLFFVLVQRFFVRDRSGGLPVKRTNGHG
jgi:multidrug efflux pump